MTNQVNEEKNTLPDGEDELVVDGEIVDGTEDDGDASPFSQPRRDETSTGETDGAAAPKSGAASSGFADKSGAGSGGNLEGRINAFGDVLGDAVEGLVGVVTTSLSEGISRTVASLGRKRLPPKPKKPHRILRKAISGLLFVPVIIIGVFFAGMVMTSAFSGAASGTTDKMFIWLQSTPTFLFQLLAVGGVSLVAAVLMVYGNRAREKQYRLEMLEWTQRAIMQLAVQKKYHLTVPEVVMALEISMDDAMTAMDRMVMMGIAELKIGEDGGIYYWFPALLEHTENPVHH